MADDDYTWTDLKLVGKHVPDSEEDSPPDAHDVDDPKTGTVLIGVEVDGAFLPIFSERAGFVFSRIERAKQARESESQPTE